MVPSDPSHRNQSGIDCIEFATKEGFAESARVMLAVPGEIRIKNNRTSLYFLELTTNKEMRRRRIGTVVSSTHAAVGRVFVHTDWTSAALGCIWPALVSTSNELRFATRKYSALADNLTAREKELTSLSLLEIKERLDNGSNTCEEIVSACIKQRQNIQALNAFITTVPEDELLHSSQQADQRRKSRKGISHISRLYIHCPTAKMSEFWKGCRSHLKMYFVLMEKGQLVDRPH